MNERLLSCAFAAADLLFEIDPDHRTALVLGAGLRVVGRAETDLIGSDWRGWLSAADREMAAAFVEGLNPGERRGPIVVRLGERQRLAELTALATPSLAPNVSCAMTLRGSALSAETPRGAYGLYDLTAFEAAVERLRQEARAAGAGLDLSLIRVRMPDQSDAGRRALARLAGVLRAEAAGGAAAQAGYDRFAVLRHAERPNRLEAQILAAADAPPEVATVAIAGPGSVRYALGAIRAALRRFAVEAGGPEETTAALSAELAKAAAHAEDFARAVRDRSFSLAFQPIVSLADRELHHYEALVRFQEGESPAEAIWMAEDLDLIESFDLALAEAAVERMARPDGRALKLSVNLSARSVMSRGFLDELLAMLRERPDLELDDRLSFEITETFQFDDLAAADAQIQRLRREGFKVALDDLGAGAASLGYLRGLAVDAVKIDGAYVRTLLEEPRNEAVLSHLIAMCRDLGLPVTAEMVESPAVEARLKALGVDLGQGWLYGRPEPEPRATGFVRPTGAA